MMKANSIQFKAAFLMLVFGLNTIVGTACSIGIDMGFNTGHHSEVAHEINEHKNGSHHVHASKKQAHAHEDASDNCCNDKVLQIAQADKAVPQVAQLISPRFFTEFVTTFTHLDLSVDAQVNTFPKYFLRSYHPPILDIRIAIQSFQI